MTAGTSAVDRLDLQVHAGEIVGIAGVQGNGQTELVEAITGLRRGRRGQIRICGRGHHGMTPRARVRGGRGPRARGPPSRTAWCWLHDRREHGAQQVLPAAVRERHRCSTGTRSQSTAKRLVEAFDVRTPSVSADAGRPLGREPAEGHRGARVLATDQAADRRPADARPGRRLDRVHPPADHRAARPGRRGAAGLDRAGRGPRAGRPDRRDVPGRIMAILTPARSHARAARAADGRRRGRRTAWPPPRRCPRRGRWHERRTASRAGRERAPGRHVAGGGSLPVPRRVSRPRFGEPAAACSCRSSRCSAPW